MPFDYSLIEDALNSDVDPKEVEAFAAESDPLVKEALAAGVPLTEVINHYKSQGGESKDEYQIPTSPEGPRQESNAQDGAAIPVQTGTQQGLQTDRVLPAQDQSQLRGDDQADLTTTTDEGQTQDAQGGIQGAQEGQGIRGQIPAGQQEEVISPQQAAMKAAPFGAEGVQPAPAKSFMERVEEDPRSAIVAGLATAAEAGIPLLAGSVAAKVITPLATAAAAPTGMAAPFIGGTTGLAGFAGAAEVTRRIVKQTEEALGISSAIKEAQAKQPEITKVTEMATMAPFLIQSGAGLLRAAAKGTVEAAVKDGSLAAGAAKEVGKRLAAGGAAGTLYEAGVRYPVEKGIQMVAGGEEPQKPTASSIAESAITMAALSGAGEEIIRKAGLPETAEVAGSVAPDAAIEKRFEQAKVVEEPAPTPEPPKFEEAPAKPITLEPIKEAPKEEVVSAEEPAVKTASEVEMVPTPGVLPGGKEPPTMAPKAEYEKGIEELQRLRGDDRMSLIDYQQVHSDVAQGIDPIEAAQKAENEYQARKYAREEVGNAVKSGEIPSGPQAEELFSQKYNERIEQLKPAEAPAEAQPLPPLERKSVEPEAAVKTEEGVAPREGEGEEGQVASAAAEAAKEEVAAPEGTRVAAAAYLAPDGNIYEGADHIAAMKEARNTPRATPEETMAWQQEMDKEIAAKEPPQERNTEEFGYAVTLPDGTRTTTTREAAGKIAKASGQALKEEFDFGDKMHSNETKLDDFPKAGEAKQIVPLIESKTKITYQEAQDKIDAIEDKLEKQGIDITKLYSPGLEDLQKYGYSPMPEELFKAYEIRDSIGKSDLESNIKEIKSILPKTISENETKRILNKYALGDTDAAGQYMASEYTQNAVSRNPLNQAEEISYILADERGELFDELKDISYKTKQDAVDIVKSIGDYFGIDHSSEFIKKSEKSELPQPSKVPTLLERAESWADSVIKESQKRVSTGLDPEVLVAYGVKGSVIIARGVRNFGAWSKEFLSTYGDHLRPHIKDIWSKAKSYAEDEAKVQMETKDYIQRREEALAGGEKSVMRGASERLAKEAGEGSEKEYYIQADELAKRKQLSDVDVMDWVNSLTPEQAKIEYERAIFAPASEDIALIKGKLAVRRVLDLEAAGDIEGAARVINEIAREQTVGAYVVRDAQFLYKTTPSGFTTLLQKLANARDIVIKPEKIEEVRQKFSEFQKAAKASEQKASEAINATSEAEFNAALKDLEKLRREGFNKQTELEEAAGSIWPKSGREELIPSLARGNYLTPISAVTNFDQNLIKGPFIDVPGKMLSSLYSRLESAITGKERQYVFGPEQAAKYIVTLAKESPELVRNVFRSVLRIPLPVDRPISVTEVKSALNPKAAFNRLRSIYKKDNLQYEGDYTFKEKIKDSLEAISGLPASVYFDLLTATDRPTRQAAKISEASGMARRLGLKGLDYEKFLIFPEKGIESYVRQKTKDPAKRASEIRELKKELSDAVSSAVMESEVSVRGVDLTKAVSSGLKRFAKINPITSIVGYATIPYIRVPLNFAALTLKFGNPELAMTSFLMNAARGNSKKAAADFGIMAVSSSFAFAGAYLWQKGVIETTDTPQTKAATLSSEVGRAGTINMSKLNRLMKGESLETMYGDDIRRLDRLGLPGVAMLMEADKQERLKQKKLLTGKLSFGDAFAERLSQMPASLAYTLNSTFVKGVAGVFDAITKNKLDNYAIKMFESALTMVAPNTLSAASRFISKYSPELKDPSFVKSLENVVRQKFFLTGDLPSKRDFWGEKVTSTPEGANAIMYHFFDYTKKRDIPNNIRTMEMMRLFDKTQDKNVIPSEVQDNITIKGTKYQLSAKDHERYQEIVGKLRAATLDALINKPDYQSASFDRKAVRFGKILQRAQRVGEKEFLKELKNTGRPAGEVLTIPRKDLIKRISELDEELNK